MSAHANNAVSPATIEAAIERVANGNVAEFARRLDVSRETVYKYKDRGLDQDQTRFAFRLMAQSSEMRDRLLEEAGVTPPSELSGQVRRLAARMAVIEEADPDEADDLMHLVSVLIRNAEKRIGPDRLGKIGGSGGKSSDRGERSAAAS